MNPDIRTALESLNRHAATDPTLAGLNLPSLARPSVRLATQRVPYALIELGDSRIGGIPDVPSGFEWPRWKPSKARDDKYGERRQFERAAPLGFIAQIDLSAVPHVDDLLPTSGWLYFFYDRYSEPGGFDPADRGCCRVLFANCARSVLMRTEPPTDADPKHTAEACAIEPWPELTLPECTVITYGDPAFEVYHRLCDDLVKASVSTNHRLLGHPQLVQNPMELECQLASNGVYCGGASHFQQAEAEALAPGAVDWRLLLQIDTDEDGPGWMWGDVGRIYFWIKKQDLAALRFNDAWLVFQCC